MSTAAEVDLVLDQGADFGIQIYWTDADSNPFTVMSPMRMDVKNDVGAIITTLQTNDDAPVDTDVTILYDSGSGLIQLLIPAATTSTMPSGVYRYDLFVTYQDNAQTMTTRLKRLLEGSLTVQGRVTLSV